MEIYGKYIKQIDTALESELDLYQIFLPFKVINGGKESDLILILAAESIGKVDGNAYAAHAVEFLHTESVIHDDIIDNETKDKMIHFISNMDITQVF